MEATASTAKPGRSPLPVLLEDRSRFDWRVANYEPEVRVEPTRATVIHRLRDAPTLERLVAEGSARWATELRCPKTLLSRVEQTSETHQVVTWTADSVDGDMYVIPGLLAVSDFHLAPEAGELTPIWQDAPLDVGKGWWMARGSVRRTKTLGQSLLKFHRDEKLDDGQMRIRRNQNEEDLHFHVHLAGDIWQERTRRHVQIAALIGAFGQLGVTSGEEDDEPRVAREIRQRLEEKGVATWRDGDFDPAGAATAIEPLYPTETGVENTR